MCEFDSDRDYAYQIAGALAVLSVFASDDHDETIAEIIDRAEEAGEPIDDYFLAVRLYQLIPISLGRQAILADLGVTLPDRYFIVNSSDGSKKPYLFSECSLYRQIDAIVPELVQQGFSLEHAENVAARSPEVAVVNQAIESGSDPKNLTVRSVELS